MKVIALDPGITTGYAVGIIDLTYKEPMGVLSGQEKWDEFDLYEQLRLSKPDIIVYESFEYRSERFYGKGQYYKVELFSRNLIGVIHLYVKQRQVNDTVDNCIMYEQTPSKGLGGLYKNDATLKQSSVFKVGKPHANDAMRHLLTWYTVGSGFQYDKAKKGFVALA